MTLSRETKIGLAVAGSFLCLVGAILAAQFCKSPPPVVDAPKPQTPPVVEIKPQIIVVNEVKPAPHAAMVPNVSPKLAPTPKVAAAPHMGEVVAGSENLKNLQGEYRRFWNKDQPPRVTAIHLPPSLSGPINFPNAVAPTPKLATPLRSTQNPWDVSLAPPLFEDSPEARWIGLFR